MPDTELAGRSPPGALRSRASKHIILFCYLFAVGGAVALLAIAELAFRNQRNSQEWVLHTLQVIAGIESLQHAITDAESSTRGYLVSGDSRFLSDYQALKARIHGGSIALRSTTADNARQQVNLEALNAELQRLFAELDVLVEPRTPGRNAQPVARMHAAADLMGRLKALTAAMRAEEERLFFDRIRARDSSVEAVALVLMVAGLAGIAVLSLLFRYVHRLWRLQGISEAEALEWAHHDALTGLPNRRLLYARIAMTKAHADRHRQMFGVLCLDLDGFKAVNDSLGHDAGDRLLKLVGERLTALMRGEDTVARLGGDEFVVTLFHANQRSACERVAEKIIDAVGAPCTLGEHDVRVGTSIGIALYPVHGTTDEELLRCADRALYAAKSAGKGCYRFAAETPLAPLTGI